MASSTHTDTGEGKACPRPEVVRTLVVSAYCCRSVGARSHEQTHAASAKVVSACLEGEQAVLYATRCAVVASVFMAWSASDHHNRQRDGCDTRDIALLMQLNHMLQHTVVCVWVWQLLCTVCQVHQLKVCCSGWSTTVGRMGHHGHGDHGHDTTKPCWCVYQC
jgi:hypothetical protein